MQTRDYLSLGIQTLRGHRLRAFLSALGIAIGIAAVILLTSIGEGLRQYMMDQFTQFGTNVIAINPGKSDTMGMPGIFGGTTHKLTIDDAESLRRIPGVSEVVPLSMGQARVRANGRGRSVFVYGVTSDMPRVWKFDVGQGNFLPAGDPRRAGQVAVLGPKLRRELFGEENALGRFVRIGDFRLRVIGVMSPKGRMLGIDIDDSAYVPVATAMQLFNQDELFEIDLVYHATADGAAVVAGVTEMLTERHRGHEDFTITTQEAMLEVMDNVISAVTFAVAAIAGISLIVGAIGIFSIMWIAVGERVSEIGLLRAIGATGVEIQRLFLLESVILTVVGGVCGLLLGLGAAQLLGLTVSNLPVHTPLRFLVAALVVSALTGVVAGVVPARRAAALRPVEALRAE